MVKNDSPTIPAVRAFVDAPIELVGDEHFLAVGGIYGHCIPFRLIGRGKGNASPVPPPVKTPEGSAPADGIDDGRMIGIYGDVVEMGASVALARIDPGLGAIGGLEISSVVVVDEDGHGIAGVHHCTDGDSGPDSRRPVVSPFLFAKLLPGIATIIASIEGQVTAGIYNIWIGRADSHGAEGTKILIGQYPTPVLSTVRRSIDPTPLSIRMVSRSGKEDLRVGGVHLQKADEEAVQPIVDLKPRLSPIG